MRVLMIGWEFPPLIRGGLGFATYAIATSLARQGVTVTLILPFNPGITIEGVRIIPLGEARSVSLLYHAYHTRASYQRLWKNLPPRIRRLYASDLISETDAYAARLAAWLETTREDFDLIHAHDWLTLSAGLTAKQLLNKPLVVHVHATEYDRHGGRLHDTLIREREYHGFHGADMLIAISKYTRDILVKHYHIPPGKIRIAYNGADHITIRLPVGRLRDERKIILFAGRLTIQKGPLQFIRAAARAVKHDPDALIIIAGNGELWDEIIAEAREQGIADRLLMTGFLPQEELSRLYATATVVVMPSVSEPFGLTAVEAALHGTPVIVSRQSGVAEILPALQVDYWDEEKLAHYLISILTHPPLRETMRIHLQPVAKRITWDETARAIITAYEDLLAHATH